jgi:hypothetical protein
MSPGINAAPAFIQRNLAKPIGENDLAALLRDQSRLPAADEPEATTITEVALAPRFNNLSTSTASSWRIRECRRAGSGRWC